MSLMNNDCRKVRSKPPVCNKKHELNEVAWHIARSTPRTASKTTKALLSWLMKLKVMSREMRVFVSVIVWLSSVIGADGQITLSPENYVLVKGSVVTLHCASNTKTPEWFYRTFDRPTLFQRDWATDGDCGARDETFGTAYNAGSCDLTVKNYTIQSSWLFACTDYTDRYAAILIFIESALKCEILDNKLGCTMVHSAYNNKTELEAYLSSHLSWKDGSGKVVAEIEAGFGDTKTVAKTEIPASLSEANPFVCSAEFKLVDQSVFGGYSEVVKIVPGGKLECKFPETAEQAKQLKAAAAATKERAGN